MSLSAEDKTGIAANVVVVMLGGRKMVGLGLSLLALMYGPEASYPTVAMVYGMFVGGNGWEHHAQTRSGGGPAQAGAVPVAAGEAQDAAAPAGVTGA